MLWKVFRTVQQMLVDRGVIFEDGGHIVENVEDFQALFGPVDNRNAMAFVTSHPRIGIFFAEPETISVDHLNKYKHYMLAQHIKHAILITRNALSSPARKLLNDPRLYIEAFKENELVLNITKHILVPRHEKISKDQTLFDESTAAHLPKLHRGDPVCRYHGFGKGDIIKITRPSSTAGVYNAYRIVI